MKKFKSKTEVVEAMQFTNRLKDRVYVWITQKQQNITHDWDDNRNPVLKIPTVGGVQIACLDDYIVVGSEGNIYPCRPEFFENIFEAVTD